MSVEQKVATSNGALRHLRIGGVPEHFNLPWKLAIEEGLFEKTLGCTAEWVDYPGGTAPIMAALAAGEVDIATPLTEGAVTAIANGNPSKFIRLWTTSPLLWGIHVAANSPAQSEADLDSDLDRQRFAISRFGSGSELMSRVMAEDRGWPIHSKSEAESTSSTSSRENSFVIVKNLAGALKSLPAGESDIFLWNKSMTQPHVDSGVFRRVGVLPTPWPAFSVMSGPDVDASLASKITTVALARAAVFHVSNSAVSTVMERYGLKETDAAEWLKQVEWEAPKAPIDKRTLTAVVERMRSLGRIEGSASKAVATVMDSCSLLPSENSGKIASIGSRHDCSRRLGTRFASDE